MGETDRSRVVLIAIGIVVAVLVGVAVVFALQSPEVLDPTTPEGTTQGYFQALQEGDEDLVASYLTDDIRETCDEFSHFGAFNRYPVGESVRVVIVRTDIDDGEAAVEVEIMLTYGEAPFEVDSDRFHETLVMKHSADRWLISEPPWPWDEFTCERDGQ